MKQVVAKTSTYSSDQFGVCSALYELGGMVVMHDASGCNSTYTTHDEPRWYEKDSMIYISALSEIEAVMGDDAKFIDDLTKTTEKLKPEFIAMVGCPIPYMIGTDFNAIASIVKQNTGIPCFGFQTTGMGYYTLGISMALETIADFYCTEVFEKPDHGLRVNILGATPLDHSLNGTVDAIRNWLNGRGFEAGACFAMDDTLEDLKKASSAHVNLVISYGGLAAARLLEKRFGTPYVVGVPYGKVFSNHLKNTILQASLMRKSMVAYNLKSAYGNDSAKQITLIGESVLNASLAAAIEMEHLDLNCRVICPLDTEPSLLRAGDLQIEEEDSLADALRSADQIIADPLYRILCPDKEFTELPHTAFSGRLYEKNMPVLIGDLAPLL